MEMAGYDTLLKSPIELANRVEKNLVLACPESTFLIQFENEVQRHNLSELLLEADSRLQRYEHIYQYIKEICQGQKINPSWYMALEKVLNWALSKGHGDRTSLSREIKDAWLTYIVLLSCSMIDRSDESKLVEKLKRSLKLNYDKSRLFRLMGKN